MTFGRFSFRPSVRLGLGLALIALARLGGAGPALADEEVQLALGDGPVPYQEGAYRLHLSGYLDGSSGWSKLSTEQARDVALDRFGNLYVVGGTSAPDFPTTAGALDRSLGSGGRSGGGGGRGFRGGK